MWQAVQETFRLEFSITTIIKVIVEILVLDLKCTVLDINQSMLDEGQKRANQMGLPKEDI
jgi:hypothetical protein